MIVWENKARNVFYGYWKYEDIVKTIYLMEKKLSMLQY